VAEVEGAVAQLVRHGVGVELVGSDKAKPAAVRSHRVKVAIFPGSLQQLARKT